MKEAWTEFKRTAFYWFAAMFLGFVVGKIYTWDTIITDCKVLGTFRIANVPFYCKVMTP